MLEIVHSVGILLVGVGFVLMGSSAKGFLDHIRQHGLLLRMEGHRDPTLTGYSPTQIQCGYALYSWDGGSWQLVSDFSLPGYTTTPPQMPGSYEGQVIRKEAAAR